MVDRLVHTSDNDGSFSTRLHDNGDGTFSAVNAAILIDPSTGLAYAATGGGGGGGAVTVAAGADATEGNTTDAAYSGAGAGTLVALLKGLYAKLAGTLAVTGTFWQATQPVSLTTLPAAPAPTGSNNFATGQNTAIGTSATSVVAARAGRVSTTLYNSGQSVIFYGPAGVTTTNGTRLLIGGSRTIQTAAAIFGVVAVGVGALDFDETY